jgi:GNAT superfamily N-acetyltransferase
MIRQLSFTDVHSIWMVINEAAQAYNGIIPKDRWREPYMSAGELRDEIESGVVFYGWITAEAIVGVMGVQVVKDTTLIRHAYVLPAYQGTGIGGTLLHHLINRAATRIIFVGTWADAIWAIRFYEEHGFQLVAPSESERLLRKYWTIPERQIETSVVLKYTHKVSDDRGTVS